MPPSKKSDRSPDPEPKAARPRAKRKTAPKAKAAEAAPARPKAKRSEAQAAVAPPKRRTPRAAGTVEPRMAGAARATTTPTPAPAPTRVAAPAPVPAPGATTRPPSHAAPRHASGSAPPTHPVPPPPLAALPPRHVSTPAPAAPPAVTRAPGPAASAAAGRAAPPAAGTPRVIPPLPDEDDVPFDEPPGGPRAAGGGGAASDGGDDGAEDGDDDGADDGPGSAFDDEPDDVGTRAGSAAHALLEAVRRGERHISVLDALPDAEVVALAAEQGWRPRSGERRSETLFRLLQGRAQPEVRETVFTEGLLELHPDGYGFLRRPQNHYAQHPFDVYVAAGLVRRYGLRVGHWVSGEAHRARPGEPYFALHEVQEVNHEDPAKLQGLKRFEDLTVVYPDQRYVLEVNPADVEMRLMDLFCPLGRGQRGLIVAPPRTGKTILMTKIADSIAHNAPNADIVVLLVDERPEEVTNMKRSVRGEVIASTFDKPVANHVRVAELVIEKVKRMVELGRHVVLLLDSITRLGRAYNNLAPTSGRILSGGMDAGALTKPKLFFASARNVEDGGSLTILATALVDTGSRLDNLVFEEFKGSGNMEVVLDRDLANLRIWPAINIPASGTRNEDLLLHPEELRRINRLRRALSDHGADEAMLALKDLMKTHKTNAELLLTIE